MLGVCTFPSEEARFLTLSRFADSEHVRTNEGGLKTVGCITLPDQFRSATSAPLRSRKKSIQRVFFRSGFNTLQTDSQSSDVAFADQALNVNIQTWSAAIEGSVVDVAVAVAVTTAAIGRPCDCEVGFPLVSL